MYLTHAVLRRSSPLRSLFELAAELLPEGVAPEELGACVEDLPCVWQGVPVKTVGPEAVRACVSFVLKRGRRRMGGGEDGSRSCLSVWFCAICLYELGQPRRCQSV